MSKPPSSPPKAGEGGGSSGSGPKRGTYPIINPIFRDVCELQGITLTRYMLEVSRANPHLVEIESLMNSIQTACKTISSLVERACITGMTGYKDEGCSINVQVRDDVWWLVAGGMGCPAIQQQSTFSSLLCRRFPHSPTNIDKTNRGSSRRSWT